MFFFTGFGYTSPFSDGKNNKNPHIAAPLIPS